MIRFPGSPDRGSAVSWVILRVTLAGLLAAHGWARLLSGGVEPFGVWLDSQGFPLGWLIASGVTGIEMAGTALFAWGIWVFPLSLVFSAIYVAGAVLVHWPAGWFVVGLGRNGVEYSVLLVVCLLLVGFRHRNRGRSG